MAPQHNNILKALEESRKKIAQLENERDVFTEMYRELLSDFKQLFQLYIKNVGKEPFVSDESIPSGYSSSKSSLNEVETTPKANYYRDETPLATSDNRPQRVDTPEFFVAGDTEPSHQQLRKRDILLQRTQQRLEKIKEASIQRGIVADAIKKLSAEQLAASEHYFDDYELCRLFEKQRAIEAFPMVEIRRATAERLIKFGVYEKEIKERLAQERRAVSSFVANYASEHHRQRVLRNFNYVASIRRPVQY